MGNTLVALEQNPNQPRHIAEDPHLLPAAIEESMRWCGPLQSTSPRLVITDTEVGGIRFSEGQTVSVFLAATNRDPKNWKNPNLFDIHREAKFAGWIRLGPHLCLGAALARSETKVAVEYLLSVPPEYSLRVVALGNSFFVRGPERGFIEVGIRAPA